MGTAKVSHVDAAPAARNTAKSPQHPQPGHAPVKVTPTGVVLVGVPPSGVAVVGVAQGEVGKDAVAAAVVPSDHADL